MVGEVIAGEVLDPIGVAPQVSGGDLDDVAVLGGDRERLGAVHEPLLVVASEESGRHHGGHVVAVVGAFDDLGDRGGPDGQVVDQVFGLGGHACIVGASPDTALTRTIGPTVRK